MKNIYLLLIFTFFTTASTFSQNVSDIINSKPSKNFEGLDLWFQNALNNTQLESYRLCQDLLVEEGNNSLSARTPLKYLLDSSYRYSTNNNGNIWDNHTKSYYAYFANGKVKEENRYRYINNIWSIASRNLYKLNAQNLESETLSQQWDNVSKLWVNSQKYESTYNANGLATEFIFSSWNKTTLQWTPNTRILNKYLPNNILTESEWYSYDLISKTWNITSKLSYSYDSNGLYNSYISQNYVNSKWVNNSSLLITYNSKKLIIEENYSKWDVALNKFVPSTKNNYSYNQVDLLEEEIYNRWNESLKVFEIESKYNTIFDQNNNPKESYYYYKDQDSTNLIAEDKSEYFYSLQTITKSEKIEKRNEVEVYPNPFQNILFLSNLLPDSKLIIFDMNGKIVYQTVNNDELDLSGLSSGLYILNIRNGMTSSNHQIVKY